MGASSFFHEIKGPDLSKEFDRLVADAQHKYGHDGYTGTIAEKAGPGVIPVRVGRLSRVDAHREAKAREDEGDKWGPALAIAYYDSVPVGPWVTGTKFRVPAFTEAAARTAALKLAAEKAGEGYHVRLKTIKQVEGPTNAVDVANPSKPFDKKGYYVVHYREGDHRFAPYPTFEHFPMTPEGRKAAGVLARKITEERAISRDTVLGGAQVISVTPSAAYSPGKNIKPPIWEVTWEKLSEKRVTGQTLSTEVAGWFVFGWASA